MSLVFRVFPVSNSNLTQAVENNPNVNSRREILPEMKQRRKHTLSLLVLLFSTGASGRTEETKMRLVMDYPAILPRNSAKSGSLVSCIGLCVADLMSQNESCYAVVYSGDQSLCNYGTLVNTKIQSVVGPSHLESSTCLEALNMLLEVCTLCS